MTGPELSKEVQEGFVEPSGDAFRNLVEIMAKLRAPDGCPWDREQTHESLARHLLEETYETLEAIDNGDLRSLREELGDLVLQVIFHSEIAFEEGAFGVADVLDDLRSKLIHRHPHVFGDVEAETADDVLANWERNKRKEKGRTVFEGIPSALPALARASKMHGRAVQVGFLGDDVDTQLSRLAEEIEELRQELEGSDRDTARVEEELGDVLSIAASLGHRVGVEPETALRRALDRFERRFEAMERFAAAERRELESLSRHEWAQYWEQAKKETSN